MNFKRENKHKTKIAYYIRNKLQQIDFSFCRIFYLLTIFLQVWCVRNFLIISCEQIQMEKLTNELL